MAKRRELGLELDCDKAVTASVLVLAAQYPVTELLTIRLEDLFLRRSVEGGPVVHRPEGIYVPYVLDDQRYRIPCVVQQFEPRGIGGGWFEHDESVDDLGTRHGERVHQAERSGRIAGLLRGERRRERRQPVGQLLLGRVAHPRKAGFHLAMHLVNAASTDRVVGVVLE